MRGSRDLTGLRKLFATQHNLSLRAAQWHAQKRSQLWLDFTQIQASAALRDEAPSPASCDALVHTLSDAATVIAPAGSHSGTSAPTHPPAMEKPPALRTPEEHAECEAWLLHCQTCQDSKHARDSITKAGLAKTAADTLKAYLTAKAARERAEIASRQLVPAREFNEAEIELQKIASRLQVADREIGPRANPANPAQGAAAVKDWFLTVFNPAIQALAASLRTKGHPVAILTPAPASS